MGTMDNRDRAAFPDDVNFGLTKLEYATVEAMKGFIIAYPTASRNEISGMARDQAVDVFKCLAELEKES